MGQHKRGFSVAAQQFEEQGSGQTPFIPTFMLLPGSTKKVIFLTGDPVTVMQHTIPQRARSGKRYFRPIVSPVTFDENAEDALADAGSRAAPVAYFTVVEIGKYTDKNGKVHRNEKKLVGFYNNQFDLIKRKRNRIRAQTDKKKGLKFALFEVSRGKGTRSPRVGDDWEFVKHLTTEEVLAYLRKGDPKATVDELDPEVFLAAPKDAEYKRLAKEYARNAAKAEEEADDDADEEEEEETPKKSKAKPKVKKKTKAKDDEEEEEEEESEEDEDSDDEDGEEADFDEDEDESDDDDDSDDEDDE